MCRRHEVSLPGTATAPAQARTIVAQECTANQVEELRDTAELLTSELVTNAVVHTGQAPQLAVAVVQGDLLVEVRDSDPTPPEVLEAGPDRNGGRGLALVSQLADDWGVRPNDGGKAVWFELHPEDPPAYTDTCACHEHNVPGAVTT